jgi:hypothetical protein
MPLSLPKTPSAGSSASSPLDELLRNTPWVPKTSFAPSLKILCELLQDAPVSRPVQQIGRIVSHALVGELHHQYVRI